MGFDITLHPVSVSELRRYCIDVIDDPALAAARTAEITDDPQCRREILRIYSDLADLRGEIRRRLAGEERKQAALPPDRRTAPKICYFGTTFGYGAARLAGYLRPHWYSQGASVTVLAIERPEYERYLQCILDLSPTTFAGCYDDKNAWLGENFQGWGYVDHARLPSLKETIHSPKERDLILDLWGDRDALDVMDEVIGYCEKERCGFMEATDVVIPFAGFGASSARNLRASFKEQSSR